jgi:hypothetical protein
MQIAAGLEAFDPERDPSIDPAETGETAKIVANA